MKFESKRYEKFYNRIKTDAIEKENFSEDEVDSPYLDKLCKKTKSPRILRMIRLAYYLGYLRGIKSCDELFNTEVSISD